MSALLRDWDSFDVYLFDIDGTLLHCSDAVHYFAFCNTLESIAARPLTLEGVTAHGNTDIGILRDALALAGVPEQAWRPRLPDIREAMCRYVEVRSNDVCVSVMPQVHDVMQHLAGRGATLGVATGNLQRIGTIKLQRANLLQYFNFAGWSDDFEFCSDVIASAVVGAGEIAGEHAAMCVVGDTPADVTAAHSNSLPAIAVATGIYSFEQLECAKPDLCIHSFADLLCAV